MGRRETVRIGIAGYMGSGKSTIARMLEDKGAVVIDADMVAKELTQNHVGIKNGIRNTFGDSVFHGSRIDFASLGNVVFGDITQLDMLNGIIHPPLLMRLNELLEDSGGETLRILDAALIPFWGIEDWFDTLVWVHASPDVRRGRLMKSRGWSEGDARMRITSQESLFAHPTGGEWRVVANDGDLENLRKTIEEIFSEREIHTQQPLGGTQ